MDNVSFFECDLCSDTKTIMVPSMHGGLVPKPCPSCTALPSPSVNKMPGVRKGARDTSRQAAIRLMPKSGTARMKVLDAYKDVYPEGLTHEEMSMKLGNPYSSTFRARASELEDMRWLRDSGKKRKTMSGDDSIVWCLTEEGARELNVLRGHD